MNLTPQQRQLRLNFRNFFLTSSVDQLKKEMEYRRNCGDMVAANTLQEMIQECEKHGVDNYGECPL